MSDLKFELWSSIPVPHFMQHTIRGVKITHAASGFSAACESERSPHANRAIALRELKDKLNSAEHAGAQVIMDILEGDL